VVLKAQLWTMENTVIDQRSTYFRLLTTDQLQQVHQATLRVLEQTGVVFEHPRAVEILAGIGCKAQDGMRVRFPPHVVEEALKKAPSRVVAYSRDGRPQMVLEKQNVYYGTVTSLPCMAEPDGTRRPYTRRDCKEMTVIMDALDTLSFGTGTGMCSDVPAAVADVHEISCMIENSPKPVLITTFDEEGLKAIMDICVVHKGSMEAFRNEPFVVYCTCPISPLKHSKAALGKMMLAVENGFPFISVSAPCAGGTTPVSLAGTLVCGNAEALSALVLSQAIRPGAPFLYGGFFTIMDMASMIVTHGSPEFSLLNAAQAEMARYYHLPSFSSAGCTDSHQIDEQAVFEGGFSILATALSGANMVHAIGVLGAGTAVSKELLVLGDELIGYTRRFVRGMEVNSQMLAVEEIDRVGPGGNFLDSDMTVTLFKKEQWFPKLFQRSAMDNWAKGGKTGIRQRLVDRCEEILRTHVPSPVAEDRKREIAKIIERSDRIRLGQA